MKTEYRNTKNIPHFIFGTGALSQLSECLPESGFQVYFIDQYFNDGRLAQKLPLQTDDVVIYVDTAEEPKTEVIDEYIQRIPEGTLPTAVIGLGGGITLDSAKAVSNLLTNGGKAEDYQGWNLVGQAGVFKIGIPTISGTGAEASRTCVMTNTRSGLKLGMNSDYTLYDQLILDPSLTSSVPKDQYFYTGMDTYIHCLESLNGSYRHPVGDAFSRQAMELSREVFFSSEMQADTDREKLMIASYLGGCAIANSFVGVVHPFSAGLSVVLGVHHGMANCIALTAMERYYPAEVEEFWKMAEAQKVAIPRGIARDLTPEQYQALFDATVIHEKPLTNALGPDYRNLLTLDKVTQIFQSM